MPQVPDDLPVRYSILSIVDSPLHERDALGHFCDAIRNSAGHDGIRRRDASSARRWTVACY